MKILFINLPRFRSISVVREERCEFISNSRVDTPATLLIMASIARDLQNEVLFIDANGFNLTFNYISEQLKSIKPDCIIFSFNSGILKHDLQICSIAKKLDSQCLTIGYSWFARGASAEVLELCKNLDIQITGPVLSIIGNLLTAIIDNRYLTEVPGISFRDQNGDIIVNTLSTPHIKFDNLPLPAYDLLPSLMPYYVVNKYVTPYALVYSGKGCPFACTYCNVARTGYSVRSIDSVMEELKILRSHKVKYIWFFDETFTIKRNRVLELCERMRQEKIHIKWFCDSRVELVDLELLKIMHKSGCIGIAYGVESGSQKILDAMNKGNTVEQALQALQWTRQAHIPIQLNILFGYIGEDAETLEATREFVKRTLPETIQFSEVRAHVNTEFSDIAMKNDWIHPQLQNNVFQYQFKNTYTPLSLDFRGIKAEIQKMLYYNPHWWLASMKTLCYNPGLLLPAIGVSKQYIGQKIRANNWVKKLSKATSKK